MQLITDELQNIINTGLESFTRNLDDMQIDVDNNTISP